MDWIADAIRLHEAGERFALGLVVHTRGSTPQKAGAAALFTADGRVLGTLGGGCLEAEAHQRALRSLDTGQPVLFQLRLDEIDGWDDGLICGGAARIFATPHIAPHIPALQLALAAARPGALVLPLDGGPAYHASGLPFEDGDAERPRIVELDGQERFVIPLVAAPRLIIAGGGHIGKATARLGVMLGFRVTVIDDRPTFANPAHFPGAEAVLCGDIPEAMAQQTIGPDTYIVIVTRGHRNDGQTLAACVASKARYIGMIGSQRKSLLIKKELVESGRATQQQLDQVRSPIGLDIGAQTVEEIAVSIAAELVQARRG
jgi:xanthine dehydrogenase accessory factor